MSSLLSVRKLRYKFRGSQRWLLQWCKTWTRFTNPRTQFNYSCTGLRFPRFSGSIRQAPWQSSKISWDSWAEPVQLLCALSWGILGLRRHFQCFCWWWGWSEFLQIVLKIACNISKWSTGLLLCVVQSVIEPSFEHFILEMSHVHKTLLLKGCEHIRTGKMEQMVYVWSNYNPSPR